MLKLITIMKIGRKKENEAFFSSLTLVASYPIEKYKRVEIENEIRRVTEHHLW